MCPRCRQNAPLIYRGMMAYCTACGAPRPPLTGASLNMAGQGSKIGGAVASAFGWLVLAGGVALALGLGLLAQAIFPAGIVGYALGIPIGLVSLVLGVVLLRSGKSLNKSGTTAERDARTQAVFALATHRGGALTALDVSQALGMRVEEADALLTSLAKEQYERVAVEIDPNGGLYYRFMLPNAVDPRARVRVDPEVARSPNRAAWEQLEAQAEAERGEAERANQNEKRNARRR